MSNTDANTDVWNALRTKLTSISSTCFASNEAMGKLRRDQDMLLAIEAVVSDGAFTAAIAAEPVVDLNASLLLLVYFEVADELNWDSTRFLKALSGELQHEALIAVFQIWGPTRGRNRRRSIPRRLFEAFEQLMQEDAEWVADRDAVRRYVADGSLKLIESSN